jgi:hypothetical protein
VAAHFDPSHRAVAIAYYGTDDVRLLETSNPEKICREGLEWLANEARSRYRGEFLLLDHNQQSAILDSVSDERPDKESNNAGTQFFAFMKSEAIRGFYTSQTGLKELDFKGNAFYARSPGCKPKAE